jgi:hypothetical protein
MRSVTFRGERDVHMSTLAFVDCRSPMVVVVAHGLQLQGIPQP